MFRIIDYIVLYSNLNIKAFDKFKQKNIFFESIELV
jgi:hypothetical protein